MAITASLASQKENDSERGRELSVLPTLRLVLAFLGLDGIPLIIASVLEPPTSARRMKVRVSRHKKFRIIPIFNLQSIVHPEFIRLRRTT